MTKIYQGKNASKIYYYLISKFGYNTVQQGTFYDANNIRWVQHTDRIYLLKPELLDAVKSAVKFAKSLRLTVLGEKSEKNVKKRQQKIYNYRAKTYWQVGLLML